jgi:hypothetical protein
VEDRGVLRFRRHRAPEQPAFLDLGDGKSPERRRADARRAHYEHQRRLLEVKDVEQILATLQLEKSAP